MWVGRREFDAFRREVEARQDGVEDKVDTLVEQMGKLRGDLKTIATLGGILVTVLTIAAPFAAALLARH